ncbi:MAG: isoprenylcysteine carboxylmethyltransferase family protein [Bacteroidota bacterium]|nr:isoprenylcysteine carboxylmethyltransferase family protein [Bacteroidota bacterium]
MNTSAIKLIVFIVATGFLTYVSRKSLRVVSSHGFYRFFAWESILALILVNISVWFYNPFSVQQIASWFILTSSLVVLGLGFQQFYSMGHPSDMRHDATLLSLEKTTTLVTSGIYHYIRHPLYASLLFLAWGAFVKDITWYSVCLAAAATISLVATAKNEECECIRYFGSAYEEYMTRTKMFIPYLF